MNAPARQPERRDAVLYSRAAVEADTIASDTRSVDVIASTETLDAHGTVLKQNWKLERYAANPVVLYAHDSCELPIGLASNVRIEGGQLRATLTFSTADLNPVAEQVWKNVQAKVLRGISVGFWPHSYRWVMEDDVEYLELDDLELYEISVVPVGSNPETLADMRARALSSRAPEPIPPVPDPFPAPTNQPAPVAQGNPQMTDSSVTPTILRALGLPAGSTESDGIACATRQHELEVGIVAMLGLQSSAEALGAMRGIKAKADRCDAVELEIAKLRGERDAQNFEVQLSRGMSERKLSAATAQLYRDEFAGALEQGRGADVVARLKGFVDVAPTLHAERAKQPASSPTTPATGPALVWNGKTYRDLTGTERNALKAESPELYNLMRDEWRASGMPARSAGASA